MDYGKVFNLSTREDENQLSIKNLRRIEVLNKEEISKKKYIEGSSVLDLSQVIVRSYITEVEKDESGKETLVTKTNDMPFDNIEAVPWKSYPAHGAPLKKENTYIEFKYGCPAGYATVRVPIKVEKLAVKVPESPKKPLIYNGKEQLFNVEYEKKYCNVVYKKESKIKGIEAGKYQIYFVPKEGYCWDIRDEGNHLTNDTSEKMVEWEIIPSDRDFQLSEDNLVFNLNDTKETPSKNVYVLFPGEGNIEVTNLKQLNAADQITVEVNSSNRLIVVHVQENKKYNGFYQIKVKVKGSFLGKKNYNDSEEKTINCYVTAWEWGDQKESEIDSRNWLYGLKNYLNYNSPDINWIGATKKLNLKEQDDEDFTNKQLKIQCIGINQDGQNSVTFMTEFTSKNSKWYKTQDEDLYDYINKKYDRLLSKSLNLLEPTNKIIWDGENYITKKNCHFFIPSATELGITNSMIDSYVGGYEDEYDINLKDNYPYAFFLRDNDRIRFRSESKIGDKYWTRSTADYIGLDKTNRDSMLNDKQIIINELGQPEAVCNQTEGIKYIYCFVVKGIEKGGVKIS